MVLGIFKAINHKNMFLKYSFSNFLRYAVTEDSFYSF